MNNFWDSYFDYEYLKIRALAALDAVAQLPETSTSERVYIEELMQRIERYENPITGKDAVSNGAAL